MVIKILDTPATRGYSTPDLTCIEIENTGEGAYATIRGIENVVKLRDLCNRVIQNHKTLSTENHEQS